ncbi:aspartate carbamoyltransferase regulatory subunit [Candidatus Woesearchaeota archaeon]|nr:aspartate carbamoyltransferase regulatory subunit [Candidatus Woesearchaeota archaeon]
MKEIKIPAIKRGVVIDHIDTGRALDVVAILDLPEDHDSLVTIGMNLQGKKGKKDVVKIENKFIEKKDFDKISVVAPHATINFISNYKVKEKFHIRVPGMIEDILKCSNPNCVTNHESCGTRFLKVSEDPLVLKCYYCERKLEKTELL